VVDGLSAGWQGDAFAAGFSSQAIVRINFDGESATEVERYDMRARIRKVTESPYGAIWILEDERGESKGRLLKLTPSSR
jgi:glucose/arabinose dehydrogenase